MKPRKRVNPISERRKKSGVVYRALRSAFLEANPQCAVNPKKASTDVHHARGRAGSLLIDARFWVAVSREGHDWIQAHPIEARQRGLLCERGQWNSPPRDAESMRLKGLLA